MQCPYKYECPHLTHFIVLFCLTRSIVYMKSMTFVYQEPVAEQGEQKFWLMKSEPETRIEKGVDVKFGIEDLKKEPKQTACWDGVRNYQARNFMRDQMKVGDKAFFYHRYTCNYFGNPVKGPYFIWQYFKTLLSSSQRF